VLARALIGVALASALVAASAAHGAVVAFTSRAAFDAAIADLAEVETVDFDGVPDETPIPSGSSLDGVTFTYTIADDLGSYELIVIDSFETTSGLQSLGLTFGDVFLSGDAFTMRFDRTLHAVGLFALASQIGAGEVRLRIAGAEVGADASPDLVLPGGGGAAWFLGLVESDPAAPGFDEVEVLSSAPPGEDFEWNVDDVVSAIATPEPHDAAASAAIVSLWALRRRRAVGHGDA